MNQMTNCCLTEKQKISFHLGRFQHVRRCTSTTHWLPTSFLSSGRYNYIGSDFYTANELFWIKGGIVHLVRLMARPHTPCKRSHKGIGFHIRETKEGNFGYPDYQCFFSPFSLQCQKLTTYYVQLQIFLSNIFVANFKIQLDSVSINFLKIKLCKNCRRHIVFGNCWWCRRKTADCLL